MLGVSMFGRRRRDHVEGLLWDINRGRWRHISCIDDAGSNRCHGVFDWAVNIERIRSGLVNG